MYLYTTFRLIPFSSGIALINLFSNRNLDLFIYNLFSINYLFRSSACSQSVFMFCMLYIFQFIYDLISFSVALKQKHDCNKGQSSTMGIIIGAVVGVLVLVSCGVCIVLQRKGVINCDQGSSGGGGGSSSHSAHYHDPHHSSNWGSGGGDRRDSKDSGGGGAEF